MRLARRCGLGAVAVIASLAVSSTVRAQGVLAPLPLPPMPLPLPPPTSNAGDTSPAATPPDAQLSVGPRPARSDSWVQPTAPADLEALRRSRMHEVWTGWQTATVDGAAVGVLLLGAEFHDVGTALGVSSVVYALGPPLVHFARGEVGKGLASLALRILLPVAGFGIGSSVGGGAWAWQSGHVTVNEGVGAVAGGACAVALDAAVLGWDRWQDARTASTALALDWAF